jgi:hypothetical protein
MKRYPHILSIYFMILIFLSASNAPAQYKTLAWENFEYGVFPESMEKIGGSIEDAISVMRYSQLQDYEAIISGAARTECGQGCLVFKVQPLARYLRVISKNKLDRKAMGERSLAIVQADFYIRKLSEPMVGMAVLATEINPASPKLINRLYRLGVNNKGEIYFSFYDGTDPQIQQKAEDYPREDMSRYRLKIPGWHRFRMVFKSQGKIHCYVDGAETSFSPVTETSLQTLQMGIMIASSSNTAVDTCITDNLSIQVSEEDIPLPLSPWKENYSPSTNNPLSVDISQQSQSQPGDLPWFTTVEEALQFNSKKGLPYLVLFYSPLARANTELNMIISSNLATRDYFRQFVLVSIDVNQLGGGSLAQKMSVFKFPCFIMINFSGQETSRAIFTSGMTWPEVYQQLNNPSAK